MSDDERLDLAEQLLSSLPVDAEWLGELSAALRASRSRSRRAVDPIGQARHGHDRDVDAGCHVTYAVVMAVSPALLKQLLMLDEHERVEIAHALLASVDDKDELGDAERAKLHAAIEQSLAEVEAGQTVPFADVIASLRAKRLARAVR